jgi:putative two-component system response regulator
MSKILIVDDEPSLRITLTAFLKIEGYEAFNAASAKAALEFLESNTVDVVVTDIIMPGMTGIELMDRIRALSQDIRVIVMTGEPTVETAVSAVKHGASDYLAKPVRREDFLHAVKNAAYIKTLMDAKRELEEKNMEYQKNLESMVTTRTQALRRSTESIINLLSQVVEVRDPYTAGHQRRVGNLAAAIADRMMLPIETVEQIRIIGYIHDIGKIVVPAEILSKPGMLSHAEIELLQNHASSGFDMLSKVNLPDIVGEAIYQHHERFDGSGYPRGLKGDEILTEAYILMVADVVEAMKSHRPYRPALGIELALNEIREKRGLTFRPDVVDACLGLFTDGYEIDGFAHAVSMPV